MTNLKILEKNLIDIGKVFDDNGINFFLSHGTLLGYFRDKRLILYDNDVDLGSFEDFNNKERREFIIEVLKKNGFEVVIRNEDNDTDRHMVVSSSEDGCKAIPYGIKFWRYNGDSMKETNFKTTYSFFKLKTVEFLGRQFKVPDRCEDLLKIWYGDGWNIKGK